MKRLLHTLCWFVGLALIIKIFFHNQPLNYLWVIIFGLSIFFGIQSSRELKISEDMSMQMITWLKNYQKCPYSKQQIYIGEIVNRAVNCNQTQDALKFLNCILEADPDNEAAKTLIISIWGTELLNNYA